MFKNHFTQVNLITLLEVKFKFFKIIMPKGIHPIFFFIICKKKKKRRIQTLILWQGAAILSSNVNPPQWVKSGFT